MQLAFEFDGPARMTRRLVQPALPRLSLRASAYAEFYPPILRARAEALEPLRQQLARELVMYLRAPVSIRVTNNRHSLASVRHAQGAYSYRLHHRFLAAPPEVIGALSRLGKREEREARQLISAFWLSQADEEAPQVVQALRSRGTFHDLAALMATLEQDYFEPGFARDVAVTWGAASTRKTSRRARSIKLGSYHPATRLIRIHPALDQAFVPRYFVDFVLYHEMLHHHFRHEGDRVGLRRCLHSATFRQAERRFADFHKASEWERLNLNQLLRR